jgi:hypothetical protein
MAVMGSCVMQKQPEIIREIEHQVRRIKKNKDFRKAYFSFVCGFFWCFDLVWARFGHKI